MKIEETRETKAAKKERKYNVVLAFMKFTIMKFLDLPFAYTHKHTLSVCVNGSWTDEAIHFCELALNISSQCFTVLVFMFTVAATKYMMSLLLSSLTHQCDDVLSPSHHSSAPYTTTTERNRQNECHLQQRNCVSQRHPSQTQPTQTHFRICLMEFRSLIVRERRR